LALGRDGLVSAWGGNYAATLGDGTFAQRSSPVLVVNPEANGFLNLEKDAIKPVPAALNVPFFVVSQGAINAKADVPNATLTANIRYKSADIGRLGSVYVFASIPLTALGSTASAKGVARAAMNGAATQTHGFGCVSLSESNENLVTSSQTKTFLTNVLGAQSGALNIMNSTQIGNLKGAEIYVNYSSNPNDAMDTSNWVSVASVPGATPGNGCNVGLSISVPLSVAAGWNLLGNPVKQTISVVNQFGDTSKVTSVWKWDAGLTQWQFYTPALDSTSLQNYAQSQGYAVLREINPGDGYWIHAKTQADLGAVMGSAITALGSANLASGWNLVSTASTITAKDFNLSLSTTPPTAGQVPINMESLWAWDPAQSRWYFYAPSLEANGGSALASYINSQNYVDFDSNGKTLGNGVGFWVKRP
jgi:hypothetical protein